MRASRVAEFNSFVMVDAVINGVWRVG